MLLLDDALLDLVLIYIGGDILSINAMDSSFIGPSLSILVKCSSQCQCYF